MRLFVLEGGACSYYQLGDTEPQGSFMLHLVRKVALSDNDLDQPLQLGTSGPDTPAPPAARVSPELPPEL